MFSAIVRRTAAAATSGVASSSARRVQVSRFSTSTLRMAGAQPPKMIAEGANKGEVPTDENQATGLERFELLSKLEGVEDIFDMKPLQVDRLGTVQDPIKVYSLFPERKVGCTGFPADSHDTLWLSLNNTLKNHRCPECGCVFTMDFQGDANAGHHH